MSNKDENDRIIDVSAALSSLPDAVSTLESKYADRGLRFDQGGFQGLEPIQAYGVIDGMRFYFRNRGHMMSLSVGIFDVEKAEAKRDQHVEHFKKELEKNPDDITAYAMIQMLQGEVYAEDDQVPPNESKMISYYSRDNPLEGSQDAVSVFSGLVDTLRPPQMFSVGAVGERHVSNDAWESGAFS